MARRTRTILSRHGIALLALFFALSGSAVAAGGMITGAKIQDESVTGADILNGSLKGDDVDEATFGTVPQATNADKLGGLGYLSYMGVASGFGLRDASVYSLSIGGFTVPANGCTPVPLGTRPAGRIELPVVGPGSAVIGIPTFTAGAGGPTDVLFCNPTSVSQGVGSAFIYELNDWRS
jgi:hypothetical protein